MSVINQMLKDLDQRQNEQGTQGSSPRPVVVNSSPKKLILTTVFIVLLINVIGLVIWQLYSENKSLKAEQSTQHVKAVEHTELENNQLNARSSDTAHSSVNNPQQLNTAKKLNQAKTENIAEQAQDKTVAQQQGEPNVEAIEKNKTDILTVQQQNNASREQPSQHDLPADVPENKPLLPQAQSAEQNESAPQLMISRKQLSASELAQQKLNQAEQALNNNLMSKAETLFEDVLLVEPENKVARKQLAALWFGKQAYQNALNLLSQGITIDPADSEYRLMKARIYLSQGQQISAVNVLKALSNFDNVEYQALLANSAQQAQQFTVASQAYQLLTNLQPEVGRWWLGLAVASDSNSQFELATQAYIEASEKVDLSESARQFARQRIQELGE